MRVDRLRLLSGAKEAKGLAVIIDVFRAFTTDAYVLANGAQGIIPVGSLEEAFKLKRINPHWILIGERGGRRVEGFDYGNSPYEIKDVDFAGKNVIQTTEAGTQGIVNARNADEIVLGSFVVAGAIVKYIEATEPETVTLVAMGSRGIEPSIEDELCAYYIEESILGRIPNFEEMKGLIREAPSGAKFFDPKQPQYKQEDFQMSLELDRFDFVMKVVKEDHWNIVKVPLT